MKIIKNIAEWQSYRKSLGQKSLGFVPTMGCLHKGHASLLERSKAENEVTVLSLFVNPTQFNNPEDYQNYPKTLEQDLAMAEALKIDAVFIPSEKALYPEGNVIAFQSTHPLSNILEGQYRPGHFNGVLTIVMKLLLLVSPHKAYFGEKDFQQLMLIKSLVKNYFLPTEIIACPTIRESSGLPFSSRNSRLSPEERKIADQFARVFKIHAKENLEKLRENIQSLPLELEYLELYEDRLFVAVRIGSIRLIDNMAS